MYLTELDVGSTARVVSLEQVPELAKKKLMVMGLLPDTIVEVVRLAPMGDPIQVRVRGFDVALRRSLAAFIKVENND